MIEPLPHRVRAAYDTLAPDHADRLGTDLAAKPLDRAMLAVFAESVRAAGAGPVADLGCGPGGVTAHLHDLGVDVSGIDLSPVMVGMARRSYPHLRFEEGSLLDLRMPEGALGGIVAWYSIIHTPVQRLPAVFAEFHRVLAPSGYLLLGFQVGDEPLHVGEVDGRDVSLDFHRYSHERVAGLLGEAGFDVQARLLREPYETEGVRQACLLARRLGQA